MTLISVYTERDHRMKKREVRHDVMTSVSFLFANGQIRAFVWYQNRWP